MVFRLAGIRELYRSVRVLIEATCEPESNTRRIDADARANISLLRAGSLGSGSQVSKLYAFSPQ